MPARTGVAKVAAHITALTNRLIVDIAMKRGMRRHPRLTISLAVHFSFVPEDGRDTGFAQLRG